MKNAKRVVLAICAVLLLSSVVVPALHHHVTEAGAAQIDCRACTWIRTIASGIFIVLASIIPIGFALFTPLVVESPESPCLDPVRVIRGPPALPL